LKVAGFESSWIKKLKNLEILENLEKFDNFEKLENLDVFLKTLYPGGIDYKIVQSNFHCWKTVQSDFMIDNCYQQERDI